VLAQKRGSAETRLGAEIFHDDRGLTRQGEARLRIEVYAAPTSPGLQPTPAWSKKRSA
jgi:hypothetical protein